MEIHIDFIFSWRNGLLHSKYATIVESISFSTLIQEESNIESANFIMENETLNYFTFPYTYLEEGVSVGEIK